MDFESLENGEKKRLYLLEVLKKFALPHFPTYFEQVVEKREAENTWHSYSVNFDIFKTVAHYPEGRNNPYNQVGKVCCVLPAPRGFWDTWLALYCLENPEVFPTVSHVAKTMLGYIEQAKLDPAHYENFETAHLNYLIRTANGETRNFFLEDPLETVFLLRSYPMIECGKGANQEQEDFMATPECARELEKIKSQVQSDFARFWENKFFFHDDSPLLAANRPDQINLCPGQN